MECRGGQDEDAAIDKEREHEGEGRVDRGELDGFGLAAIGALKIARLHNRAVQVEIVWHHRRPKDSNGDEKHLLVLQNTRRGQKAKRHTVEVRLRKDQFREETAANGEDQRNDERLDIPEAL